MKKLNDTHVFLILLIAAVALFMVVYFVPFKNTSDEVDALERNNNALRSEISELQIYHDNRAQYETDTETLKKEIVNIVSSYPSAYREEDFILEGVAIEKAAKDIQYSGIKIGDPEVLVTIDADRMKSVEIEGFDNQIEFTCQKVEYANDITYDSLKRALEEAFSSGYMANIESITYTKEEDSVIANGVLKLGYYYVSGNGKEYVPPVIEEYEKGTNNLFIGGKPVEITTTESGN